jgi:hypothetical protein
MAIYNFTGANGNPLPTGLTARNGTFEIQSNRGTMTGSVPSGPAYVFTGDGAADGIFEADFRIANSGSAIGLVYRYVDNDNFWFLACVAAQNVFRLFKREAGSFAVVTDVAFTPSFGTTYNFKVDVSGGSHECFLDSVSKLTTTSSFNQSATKTGARFNQLNQADTVDNLVIQNALTNSITITTQDYRIWQRTSSNNRSITIDGTYAGAPTTIQRSIDGGAYATAIASPSGNSFSDTFTLATGQYSIAYRFSNDTSTNDTVTFISVGDIFVGAGQSNISGRGTSNQTYAASAGGVLSCLFGNDDNYKPLSDPSDSATNQVDRISDDLLESPALAQPTGSWWLRFVNAWLASSEVPIGYIPCALGATAASQWAKTSTDRISALNLYESMQRRINAVGGVKAVFYEQGEQDSNDGVATTNSQYQALLNTFTNDINTDFGVSTYIVPLHTITRAGYNGNGTTTGQDAIRNAQLSVAAANSNVVITQPLTDIDLSAGDGIHFETDIDLNLVGVRVYNSYVGLVSTLNISISGMPDASYKTIITNPVDDSIVFASSLAYVSGSATTGIISVSVGVELTGFSIDNEATHVNGAVITGTTV